ncbi:hypothetical protein L530_3876 [Bordetella bronchiseptica MO211]|nr:hypothetical protein L530_3876 [Bordetella bronchiseptica MO211]
MSRRASPHWERPGWVKGRTVAAERRPVSAVGVCRGIGLQGLIGLRVGDRRLEDRPKERIEVARAGIVHGIAHTRHLPVS